jgi:hypothetical protein
MISPGIKWMVRRGMRITVGEHKAVTLPPLYKDATEKYSGQVKLSEDKKHVENWVAGQPFPKIDLNDPDVARKIMYDYEARWWESDDLDLRNFDADTGGIGREKDQMSVEKHFVIDSFKRMYFIGRLYVDPKPSYQPNKDEVRYKESLHPIIEPFDLKGTGLHVLPLPRSHSSRRQLAVSSAASPRAPALLRPALRRVVRPGHRRR